MSLYLICIGGTIATSEQIDSNYDESAAKLLQARLFVNGFVCETPVVVDIDRVSTLLQRLKHLEQGGVEVSAKALNKASEVVSKRLQSLFDEVNVPPALPPILFGVCIYQRTCICRS